MNPDPLTVIETDEEPWSPPHDDMRPERDLRLVLAAFAGMGVIAILAWAVQR